MASAIQVPWKKDEAKHLTDYLRQYGGKCPDCEKPSPGGVRCPECREAFTRAVDALNADLRDV